jgi:hypothetical protein
LIRTPTPDFPKMSLPIYSEVGPSLQSFPPYFASISSFCTIASSDAVNQVVVFLGSQHIPSGDGRPSKCFRFEKDVSKTRKDMAKIFETIHNNMLSYIMLEFQILKTWLVIEFYPAMRVNPPPKNPAPLTQEIPKFDYSTSYDDSSPPLCPVEFSCCLPFLFANEKGEKRL